MADIIHIGDQFGTTVEPRILEQYKGSERWKACLKAVIDKLQVVEDASFELAHVLDFRTEPPTGERLDWLAGLINVKRFTGESDQDFFARFVSMLGANSAGTPDSVIYNAAINSGDPKPAYIDEAPATFFVYTGPKPNKTATEESSVVVEQFTEEERECHGGGYQLLRRQVQKTAPAAVLGLPGAAIQFADGSFMCDAQGRIILAVADDAKARREMLIVDNNLNPIVSPQGVPLRAVIVGATVPRVEINYNGVDVDAVRIKDLPDAGYENAYMVRDSETGGTTRIDENDVGLQMEPSGTNTLKFFKRN